MPARKPAARKAAAKRTAAGPTVAEVAAIARRADRRGLETNQRIDELVAALNSSLNIALEQPEPEEE